MTAGWRLLLYAVSRQQYNCKVIYFQLVSYKPQQFLYFFPFPHKQGSFLPGFMVLNRNHIQGKQLSRIHY
jgi:hypothetical protein